MRKLSWILMAAVALGIIAYGCTRHYDGGPSAIPPDVAKLLATGQMPTRVEEAQLTFAPNVPPPIERREPALVKVNLWTEEVEGVLAAGIEKDTTYKFWTFNGGVPGPFIRVRVGDVLEVHFENKAGSLMPHNVDFHAATGTGGGAAITTVNPGKTRTARLAMLSPGLFIYHCAVPPVPDHVANGMYGLILVEPSEGLRPVDKEFYVLQSEFYTKETFGYEGLTTYDPRAGANEDPTYIVFNGRVNSLMGENALKAEVGDEVRIFFGVGGPNKVSSFHVIGEIFDRVYNEGTTGEPLRNVQTTLVPPGGSAVVEFKIDTAGSYTLVDHAIFRLAKGCVGQLVVEGEPNPAIFGKDVK
ncbi:MAG: nitrite reductase, copper-containing [Armatimonadetes bacterium]|nr:nitrite reductase, copper-containing [Armatimonadota bacterium]